MRKEGSYFRDLTFNIFHREWPGPIFLTDSDHVAYIYSGGLPDVKAVVDLKSDKAQWWSMQGAQKKVQSSVCAQYDLCSKAKVPFYVAVHDSNYSIWTVYRFTSHHNFEACKTAITLKQFMEWLYEVRGLNMLEEINKLPEYQRKMTLKRYEGLIEITVQQRDEWLSAGIKHAFSLLSERSMSKLALELHRMAFDAGNKIIALVQRKDKSA